MNRTLIKNATIINEGRTFTGSVLIEDDKIAAVYGQFRLSPVMRP